MYLVFKRRKVQNMGRQSLEPIASFPGKQDDGYVQTKKKKRKGEKKEKNWVKRKSPMRVQEFFWIPKKPSKLLALRRIFHPSQHPGSDLPQWYSPGWAVRYS
jgi:hypothetical protein